MSDLRVIRLERADPELLDQVEALFAELYRVMDDNGNLMPLRPGGEKLWRRSIERTLGRVGLIAVGLTPENRVVGFLYATVVLLPEYLEGARAGRIQAIFITPEARGQGMARRLFDVVEPWLFGLGVTSLEVQTQLVNRRSVETWQRFGFEEEVVQLRKLVPMAKSA